MEIRALTGFNEETIKKYGSSYSPLNGTPALGGISTVTEEEKDQDDKKEFKINPFFLILMGIGAYALYNNLK